MTNTLDELNKKLDAARKAASVPEAKQEAVAQIEQQIADAEAAEAAEVEKRSAKFDKSFIAGWDDLIAELRSKERDARKKLEEELAKTPWVAAAIEWRKGSYFRNQMHTLEKQAQNRLGQETTSYNPSWREMLLLKDIETLIDEAAMKAAGLAVEELEHEREKQIRGK